MRIGVYVGSFNPPHNGHYHVAKYLIDNDLVDLVLLLPTPNYWDKNNLVSVEDRINMLKFYEDEKIKVDSIHNNYEHTYEVLRSLKKDYPLDELYLVMGSDQLEKLHLWHNIDEILNNKIIVLKRGEIVKNHNLKDYDKQFIYIEDFDYIPISSTQIRKGSFINIDHNIKKYIKDNNLYE